VQLFVVNEFECADSIEILIQIKGAEIYYVPNTFTPDGDEHNNTFQAIFTSGFDPFNFEMTIFNRWGEVIWLTHDHSQGWDGSYGNQDSFAVQAGIYSWVIKFKPKDNDEKIVINGFVNVLK
jgi:gliding motility-associated-like protein